VTKRFKKRKGIMDSIHWRKASLFQKKVRKQARARRLSKNDRLARLGEKKEKRENHQVKRTRDLKRPIVSREKAAVMGRPRKGSVRVSPEGSCAVGTNAERRNSNLHA